MSDPVLNFSKIYNEAYEIGRTIDVVLDDDFYRIEVLKSLYAPLHFDVNVYREDEIFPSGDERVEPVRVWNRLHFSWIHRDSEEEALSQALDFLSERKKKQSIKKE